MLRCGSPHCTTMYQNSLQVQRHCTPCGRVSNHVAICWDLQLWGRDQAVCLRAYLLFSTGLMSQKQKTRFWPAFCVHFGIEKPMRWD